MKKSIILIVGYIAAVALADRECRFALNYKQSDLSSNQTIREEFLRKVLEKEARFVNKHGIDKESGLTISEQTLESKSGMPIENEYRVSTPESEAIQIAIMAKAISGDSKAKIIYEREDDVFTILNKKINVISNYLITQQQAYLPQIAIDQDMTGQSLLDVDQKEALQGNFYLYFSLEALSHVLEENHVNQQQDLINKINEITKQMKSNYKQYKQSHGISFKDMIKNNEHGSISHLFTPLLDNDQIRNKFSNKLVQQSWDTKFGTQMEENEQMEHGNFMNPRSIVGLFASDEVAATLWLHHLMSQSKSQSQFGIVNDNKLSWETKGPIILGILGGIQDLVRTKMHKTGHYEKFMSHFTKEEAEMIPSSKALKFYIPEASEVKKEDYTTCRLMSMPADFAWGVATASYQIEGAYNEDGRGLSIWDDFCHNTTLTQNQSGDVADDFYHKYKSDIALMKSLGYKHFRISFSWSRILPDGTIGNVNQKGVDFYNNVINECITAGIEPWVTLYHWDLPKSFDNKTAQSTWLDPTIIDKFNDYADYCFKTFGDRVKKWLTHNEQWTYIMLGYAAGVHAPGRCDSDDCKKIGGGGNSSTEPYISAHYSILSHAKAAQTYRKNYQATQGGQIGLTANTDMQYPFNSSNPDDVEAVNTQLAFAFGWFVDPHIFGDYPPEMKSRITDGRLPTFTAEQQTMLKEGGLDFIGLNHYTSAYAKKVDVVLHNWYSDKGVDNPDKNATGHLIGPYAQSNWLRVVPYGMRDILNWISDRYNGAPIIVFENGVSVPGENDMDIAEAVHDSFRVNYYKGYIKNLIDAVVIDGIDVRGYFAWSFMDNFEWGDGYAVRFGMTYVDYDNNLQRWLKDSAIWYSKFIQTGNINAAYENPYDQIVANKNKFLKEEFN